MESKIHYILGIGRSGSTLLTSILNNHSKIKGIPEIPFTIFFHHHFHKKMKIDFIKEAEEYLNLYQEIRPKNIVNLNSKAVVNCKNKSSYNHFCESVFSKFEIAKSSSEKQIYLDKNPPYTFHYNKLNALSNNSKFIILVRDYRANILSRKQKPYFRTGNVAYNAIRWKSFHKEILKYRENENCILIRYEDMVDNLQLTLENICTFFNIDFEESMLDYEKLDFTESKIESGTTDKFAKQHFSGLNRKVNSDRVHAWKTELTEQEIAISESLCGDIGQLYGYQKSNNKATASLTYIKYLKYFLKAYFDKKKETATYYLPLNFKMKRLRKSLQKLK